MIFVDGTTALTWIRVLGNHLMPLCVSHTGLYRVRPRPPRDGRAGGR
ncbi:hypothetical protein ACIO93_43735 [Streptomyces sp. NPDC087903]